MRFSELFRFLPVALLSVVLPSCTASLELDRFKRSTTAIETPASITYFDVRFGCRSMASHINEYIELRVVNKDNIIQAKAVYVDVVAQDFSIYLSKIVPKANGPHRLDFWADHNNTKKYDGIVGGINEKDHAWRRILNYPATEEAPLPEDVKFNGTAFELDFLHDTSFTDIFTDLQGNPISGADELLPFNMKLVGVEPYIGKMIEVRVVDTTSGRLVALHRQGNVRSNDYTPQVLGVLDEETPYEISIYADVDGDGKYGASEPSWKTTITSGNAGIADEVNVAVLPQTPIVTGEPAAVQ